MKNPFFKRRSPSPELPLSSIISDMVDRRRDALYDRVQLEAGQRFPSLLKMFGTPVGQTDALTGRIKTWADTNMECAHQLYAPSDMIARRFVMLFQPEVSAVDRSHLLGRYVWSLRVMDKFMQREPLLTIAMEGKPEQLVPNFRQSGPVKAGAGWNDGIQPLGIGVAWDLSEYDYGTCATCSHSGDFRCYIPALMYFNITLEGEGFQVESDLDFYMFIDGLRDWPVQ